MMDGSILGLATPFLAADANAPVASGLWPLFVQSFDAFTVLLILGSLIGVSMVFVCMIDVREGRVLPRETIDRVADLIRGERWEDLEILVRSNSSFVPRVLRAVMARGLTDRTTIREVAELAASEESARWFRRIELLNVIGNLGPLIGLAGTVWGMILAFTSLGNSGGQAGPSDLSLGISKALFHTLLGLCLAIPCLLVYGIYRSIVDRLCTRGMMLVSEFVDKLPVLKQMAEERSRGGGGVELVDERRVGSVD